MLNIRLVKRINGGEKGRASSSFRYRLAVM